MRRHASLVAVIAVLGGVCVADAGAQQFGVSASAMHRADMQLVRAARNAGRIEGLVTDERGTPLAGVAVTAHGAQLQFAVTDQRGRYQFDALPPGPYLVRAQLPGFAASAREIVDVTAAHASVHQFRLSRLGDATASPPRQLMTASLGGSLAGGDDATGGNEGASTSETEDHEHSATAWRIRHLNRSVLRDSGHDALGPDEPAPSSNFADVSTGLSVWNSLPFSGQVQLLTTSSFDSPQELFVGDRMPHGVAYVSIAAPAGSSRTWTVQGAIGEGDVSSWIFGSNYAMTIAVRHAIDVGMSYAAQRYDGANPVALAAMGDTSRAVGAMHGFDRWTFASSTMDLTAGGRYARYGYLPDHGLFSPSIQWRWRPSKQSSVHALVARQMLAPGAEEFVPSPVAGLWIPPQRTFSPLDPASGFEAERTRHMELGVEREVGAFVLAARGYHQVVEDQIVTIFGLTSPGQLRGDLGHYYTATAGDVETYGWGVSISRPVSSRVRGSVAYTISHANWFSSPEVVLFAGLARSAARPPEERIQDITTTLQTDIPETSTRVYAVYKLDTGFTRGDNLEPTPAFAGRFDVQVSQRLPFAPLGDSEWEVLVAVRNLFRDPLESSSVYDELLVVRPPKRIVGGLMVRF